MRHVLRAPGGRSEVTLHPMAHSWTLFDLSMISGFVEWMHLLRECNTYGSVSFVFVVFCFVFCRDYEERFRCSDFDLFNAEVFGL